VSAARRSTEQLEDAGDTVQLPHSALLVLLLGPSLLLTAYGVVLFLRNRSGAAALAALGFAVVLLSGVANSYATYVVSGVYNSGGALAASEITFRGWMWDFARYGSVAGMWAVSLGLLWHLLRTGAASPNNQLERTRS
jgi:hypothetical protein